MIEAGTSAAPPAEGLARPVVVGIDDEPAVLSSLKRLLRTEPYEFLATDDPAQVLEWVGTKDVALVISDQRMPAMGGDVLLEEVQKRSPHTLRMLFTGHPGRTVVIRGLTRGIQYVLYKPWDAEDLRRAIRELLGQARARSSGGA